MLTGLTAVAWLAGVLLAGTASADTGGTHANTNKPANHGNQGLGLGGLVGDLLGTVGNTVGTVTTTVTNTVTTVTNTVSVVTNTVTTTVDHVVNSVTKLPEKVLPQNGSTPVIEIDLRLPVLLPDTTSAKTSKTTKTVADTVRAETPAVAAPEVAPTAIEAEPVTEYPHAASSRMERPKAQEVAHPTSKTAEQAAPADRGPSPLPSPSSPVAPAAPCPSFSSGNYGGAGARGALATLTPQTRLAPPPLVGRLDRAHPVAERGHTPGLPVTTPD
jgi:hypothetical protein